MNLSPEKTVVFKNFLFLSVLQSANYLLPLITIPYLVRTIGIANYGVVAFVQSFAAYLVIFTDYGFSLSATKAVSINRDSNERLSEIFSSVFFIKLFFVILSFFISTIVIFSFERFRSEYVLFYFSLLVLLGQLLFPVWFFQGLEKMKYTTLTNLLIKVIFTLCIFIFIKKESDYLYVPLINSLGFFVGGLWAFITAIRQFKVKIVFNIVAIKGQLIEGWHLFLAILSTNIYKSANTFLLGLVATNTAVGYYAIASKVIVGIQALMSPLSQSLYPYLSKKYHKLTKADSIKNLFFIAKWYLLILFVIVAAILVFSSLVIKIISAKPMPEAVIDMNILSLVVMFGSLNFLFGTMGLVNLNYEAYFTKCIVVVSVLDIMLCLVLGSFFKDLGASVSFVFSEVLLFVLVMSKILRLKNE